MKCYKCKREVPDDVKFCPKCGSPQEFTRELIDRAINSDQAAITQLYNMTKDNVYYTIKTMISDEDMAQDLTQDTFLKAMKNLGQLNEPAAFRGWIKKIARNMTIDILRKRKVISFSQMVPADSDEAIEFEDDRPENLPEVVIDMRETTRLIEEILGTLSAEQRVVTELFYYEGFSVKEMAGELGVSENTVKSRLKYARNKIETGVLELEKKGTKLYSLAPIPFLLLLLRSQDAYAAELPDAFILQAIQSGSVSATAGGSSASQLKNGSNVVKKAAKTGTGAASKGGAAKIAASIIAAAVIGGAIIGIRNATTVTAEGFAGYYTDQETGSQITIVALDDENATVTWWSPLFSDPNESEIGSPLLTQKAVLDGKVLVTDSMCSQMGPDGPYGDSLNIGKHALTISNNQIIVDVLEPAQSDLDRWYISPETVDEAIGGTYDPDGNGSLAFGKYTEPSH